MCKANLSTWTVRKWRSYYRLLSHTPLTICLLTPWLTAWTLHRARLPSGSGARGPRRSRRQSQVTWAAATPEPTLIGRGWSRGLNTGLWLVHVGLIAAYDWLSGGTGHSGSLGGVGTFTSLHAKPTRSAGRGETITRHGAWRPGSGRTGHRDPTTSNLIGQLQITITINNMYSLLSYHLSILNTHKYNRMLRESLNRLETDWKESWERPEPDHRNISETLGKTWDRFRDLEHFCSGRTDGQTDRQTDRQSYSLSSWRSQKYC